MHNLEGNIWVNFSHSHREPGRKVLFLPLFYRQGN